MTDVDANLPRGWATTEIGRLCNLRNGRAFKPTDWTSTGLPIVRIQNLNDPKARYNHYSGKVDDKFLIDHGDLLFAWSGTPGTSFGAHIWGGSKAVLNQHIFRVDFDEGILLKKFFMYAINQRLNELIEKAHGGVGLRHVTKGKFESTKIDLPPCREQMRIIAKIEELFSELDKGMENLKTAREQLRVYRQAVLKHAFEGKLTGQWREENKERLENARDLLERIGKEREGLYQKRLKEWESAVEKWEVQGRTGKKPKKPRRGWSSESTERSGIETLSELPDNWRWVRVIDFADQVTDGTHFTPKYEETGIPFISVKDIRENKVHFDECKYISSEDHESLIQRCKPERGDLLITKSGTIGRLAIAPDTNFSLFVSVALVKIQSAQKSISSKYLCYAFEYHIMGLNIDQQIKGGLLKNYHLEDLRLAKLPLCSYAEQECMVALIEDKFSIVENIDETLHFEFGRLESLRQSILKRAFSGKLVDQDPNDEPASVLLERITKEKAEAEKTHKKARRVVAV